MIIDVDKFVASLIKYYCEAYSIDRASIRCWFDDVLEEQGLEYKDGEIVKTQRRIAAEAKEAIFDDEDERIRKDIMVLVKDWWDRVNKDNISTKEQMIAWLEKQGEQKPILDFKARNWYVSKVDGKIHDLTYNPTDKKELKKLTQSVTKTSNQDAWSEEDGYMLNETIQHLEELIRIDKAKHLGCDVQYYQRDIDWLKSLKDRLS